MTTTLSEEEIMNKLKEPFPSKDIEWKVQLSNKGNNGNYALVVAYVTNRAIQNRLDDVFGLAGWKNAYKEFSGGIVCELSVKINGEWITKSDGAEPSAFDAFKGGLSNAMKRAAVQIGIGRYLYQLDAMYVSVHQNKTENSIYIKDKGNNFTGYWTPPVLPKWALPSTEQETNSNTKTNNKQQQSNNNKIKNQETKDSFNRESCLTSISDYMKSIQLDKRKSLEIFHHVNDGADYPTIEDVSQRASNEELITFYKTLKPVVDLLKMSNYYKLNLDKVLNYVRILKPSVTISGLLSCITRITEADIPVINSFIEGDLKNHVLDDQTA